MSDSPGLVDFAIGLVNSVINLPDGQVKCFEEFKLQNCEINLLIKTFWGLVEMMFGLVDVSLTFFAPWCCCRIYVADFHYWKDILNYFDVAGSTQKIHLFITQFSYLEIL